MGFRQQQPDQPPLPVSEQKPEHSPDAGIPVTPYENAAFAENLAKDVFPVPVGP